MEKIYGHISQAQETNDTHDGMCLCCQNITKHLEYSVHGGYSGIDSKCAECGLWQAGGWDLGKALRHKRKQLKLNRAKLSAITGISKHTINGYEWNHRWLQAKYHYGGKEYEASKKMTKNNFKKYCTKGFLNYYKQLKGIVK